MHEHVDSIKFDSSWTSLIEYMFFTCTFEYIDGSINSLSSGFADALESLRWQGE